jgi:hypothetical protein
MDAIDILGGLLGRKASGPGGGLPDILSEILKSGMSQEPGRPTDTRSASPAPRDIAQQARELEDLLNVTRERETSRRSGESQPPKATPRRAPAGTPAPKDNPFAPTRNETAPPAPTERLPQNDQALVLVRAMVNAAKADGQISPDEQRSILEQVGAGSPEATRFLRDELTKPLDVREFAWSVPIGMEQQVYSMSLVAVDAASGTESRYLQELAHGLRLPAEVRNQLDRRYGAGSHA